DGRRVARERSDMRAAHAQRQQAQRRQASQAEPQISDTEDGESGSDDQGERAEEEEDDVESPLHFLKDSARQSLKASFLAKVMSSIIGYASDYELAQFVCDLWLWSLLGGAKHASGVQMRVALAGKPFSPEYWRTRHFALLDLQKQLGYPTLFVTIAPYEWSSPYHAFLEDELLRTFKTRLHLPGPESFHLAHILTQAALGLVTGWNKKDGKRKRGVRNERLDYHGRRPPSRALPRMAQAPGEPAMVSDCLWSPPFGQRTDGADCAKQPDLLDGQWVAPEGSFHRLGPQTAGRLHLHHPESAWKEGMRAYMPDVLASLKCHMDVQASDGRGMLLRYVAGYVPKFSDSFQSNWLDDVSSDYALARRVLTQYQPLEPEMWLQLGAHLFRQCFAGGGLSRFVVPMPWRGDLPERVQQYMASAWRPQSMTLLTYLRKTNQQGAIHHEYKKTFAAIAAAEGLGHDDWAPWLAAAPYSGAVLVAAVTKSRFSDEYYKQWCLLHVPFRFLDDLWHTRLTSCRRSSKATGCTSHRAALYWAKASTGDWDEGEGEPEEPSFTVDWSWDSAFAVLGPAGSGKSTTVMVAMEKARAAGARVVLACPTRMLVAAYRQKYPDLDVDSVHAVFQLFRPEHETLLSMATYELVVLDEVSQISAAVFERLLRIWEAAGNQPALVFIGDFAQLKGVEPTQ
ncbi:unnamed protein product, partial [Symbiodinium pilosum]